MFFWFKRFANSKFHQASRIKCTLLWRIGWKQHFARNCKNLKRTFCWRTICIEICSRNHFNGKFFLRFGLEMCATCFSKQSSHDLESIDFQQEPRFSSNYSKIFDFQLFCPWMTNLILNYSHQRLVEQFELETLYYASTEGTTVVCPICKKSELTLEQQYVQCKCGLR